MARAALALAALLAAVSTASAGQKNFRLSILHMNDNHNRIESSTVGAVPCTDESECFGGWARIATAVKMARQMDPQTLVLSAGDEFMGSLYQSVFEGNETAMLQNHVGVDAMALGNHEFDFGTEYLSKYISQLNFPVLGCNVDASEDMYLDGMIKDYAIFNVRGYHVAVYGVTTPDTAFLASPGNVTFTDPVESIKRCVAKALTNRKFIRAHILLSHLGYLEDQRIAELIPEIDVIIGGHSHSYLYPSAESAPLLDSSDADSADTVVGPYPSTFANSMTPSGNTHVVQAYWGTRHMGHLQFKYDRYIPGGMTSVIDTSVWLMGNAGSDNNIEPDNETAAAIAELAEQVNAFRFQPAGILSTPLNGERSDVRAREATMGNALCDAWVDWVKTGTELEQTLGVAVNICVTNGGGIRASLPQGQISYADVFAVLPFGNTASVLKISGFDLKESIESAVSQWEGGAGRFPQVAGIKFAFNPSNAVGSRLVEISLADGTPIEDCTDYYVVTNNFVAAGGDAYERFAEAEQVLSIGPALDIITKEFFEKMSPYTGALDGRIVSCADTPTYEACSDMDGILPEMEPEC